MTPNTRRTRSLPKGRLGELLRARDLMERNVRTIGPGESAHEIARILEEEHISGLPVVSSSGRLLGIVSQTDLNRAVAEGADEALIESQSMDDRGGPLSGTAESDEDSVELEPDLAAAPTLRLAARDLMSERVVTADEDETAGELAARMLEEGIHRLIILRRQAVVGLVSSTDLLRALAEYESRLEPKA